MGRWGYSLRHERVLREFHPGEGARALRNFLVSDGLVPAPLAEMYVAGHTIFLGGLPLLW